MLYKASATPRSAAPGAGQREGSLRASADGGQPGSVQPHAAAVICTQEEQAQRPQQPHSAAGPVQQQQQQQVDHAAGPTHAAAAPARPAAAAKPAGSRLPAPAARASRLRPPTTSSGYFSTAATNSSRWAKLLLQFAGSVVVVCRQSGGLVVLCVLTMQLNHCCSGPSTCSLQGGFSAGGGSRRPGPACLSRHQGSSWGAACKFSRRRC